MLQGLTGDHQDYGRIELGQAGKPSLQTLLFSSNGRVSRAGFWFGTLMMMGYAVIAALLVAVIWQAAPEPDADGVVNFDGVQALALFAVVFSYVVASMWSGICLGIKRYHDRDKSGAWLLVQLVPCIGSLLYMIEAGCLRGTVGPNRFGDDPLQTE